MTQVLPPETPTNTAAFEATYRRHHARCLEVAFRVTRDRHYAQDAVQEAFLAYARDPARFDDTKSELGVWLAVLTHRRAVDLVRREQSRPRPAPTPDVVSAHLTASADPEASAVGRLRSRDINVGLLSLDKAKRQIIFMGYYLGYSQSQIALATGVPLGTVKTRNRDALRQLKMALA